MVRVLDVRGGCGGVRVLEVRGVEGVRDEGVGSEGRV